MPRIVLPNEDRLMLATAKKALLPLLLSATVTAVAGAQQKAKECEVDEGTPGEVGRAMLALQVAQSAPKPEDAQKSTNASRPTTARR